LETYHHIIELYIWLSLRYDDFVDLEIAESALQSIEKEIIGELDSIEIPSNHDNRSRFRLTKRKKHKHRKRDNFE